MTIIDDVGDVHLEGNETFEVYLMDPQGASLSEPQSSIVIINDTNTDGNITDIHLYFCMYNLDVVM